MAHRHKQSGCRGGVGTTDLLVIPTPDVSSGCSIASKIIQLGCLVNFMVESVFTRHCQCAYRWWLKWLEREFTDLNVRDSNPITASRLPLSRLGNPGSISALVLPSGGMAARHQKCATAERFGYS
ncbi:hypothetical protein CSKR_113386 [Clonorchis sinensis]|uniref:Uncharacterized protein n=1 Tax=Clonorchis sinensis TaxID=79923 RepID=A0A419Q3U2_CLOSI|nr:hypothetical protein CSKR_113386 [Clonorchis sinensis]